MTTKFNLVALLTGVIYIFMSACTCPSKTITSDTAQIPDPKVIIYQTKADYSLNVPVTLSDDRTSIISYPHPADLIIDGTTVTPTQLHKNFLLDNRGINKNVAFLKYTYEEYSKMQSAPSQEVLMSMILNKRPLKKMYICKNCNKSQTDVGKLNDLIDRGDFSEFNRIR